jgi:aminoglycoside 6'-N-acetyltransferase I
MSRRVHHDRERRSHEDPTVRIERCTARTLEDWVALRYALWPEGPAEEHRLEAQALVGRRSRAVAFLARTPSRLAVGFAEATLRRDYVNGCTTSPVAFLEGIYVRPAFRRRGVARLLCAAVTDWATERGCTELASDALLRNTASHRMHAALGFEETERVVFFRKLLPAVRR